MRLLFRLERYTVRDVWKWRPIEGTAKYIPLYVFLKLKYVQVCIFELLLLYVYVVLFSISLLQHSKFEESTLCKWHVKMCTFCKTTIYKNALNITIYYTNVIYSTFDINKLYKKKHRKGIIEDTKNYFNSFFAFLENKRREETPFTYIPLLKWILLR